jgi:putative two-component system response regulator
MTQNPSGVLLSGVSLYEAVQNAKLLIVDDEPANVAMLTDILREEGYHQLRSTLDPRAVLSLYNDFSPDLILLDLMMPYMDGIAVMDQLAEVSEGSIPIPILILTADATPRTKRHALARGAKDFLTKPFDLVELLLRIENLLETRFLYLNLQQHNETLEKRVQERTLDLERAQQRIAAYAEELEAAHIETLERLARVVEFRDDNTGHHTQRVGTVAGMIAEHLDFPPETIRWIEQAARLHDIGKVAISDLTLLKPGRLTEEEFAVMKTHATIGGDLFEGGRSELIRMAHRIAASHHERWDGQGYPEGLAGEEIPIEARIISVADVFDALTHDRPYKKAWTIQEAICEIKEQSGKQFDPRIVAIFLQLPHDELV